MSSTRRKLAIATWSAPREANIYGKLSIDAGGALAYVEHLRKQTGEKVTIGHIVGKAAAMAMKSAPGLNGRIVFGKFVPHETVDVTFLVALEEGQDLAKTKIARADEKTITDIARALGEGAGKLREGRDEGFEKSKGIVRALPSWALKPVLWTTGFLTGALGVSAFGLEPFPFGSCVVTNVGALGIDEGYAPPTPFARVPVLLLVGAVKEQPAVVAGEVVPRPMITITATVDHRFIDGAQLGVLGRMVRKGVEEPWTLDGLSRPPWAEDKAAGAQSN
jgi:pyruvate/2-oxoglutarate dehydrogenase complex dihydrolipoamide acyltransferase (E2) component